MNSLGINKDPKDTRVVVAMSGGVDSSVVAAMLAKEGYDVVGITLQLYDHGEAVKKKGACCAGQDIYDARRVAEAIGFPHYVLDYESRFRQSVIDDFADSYLRGETPIPCVKCNQQVKFKDLLQTARDLNADVLATGHYVQRKVGAHGAELHQPADLNRDQSYFLFGTTQDQLDFLRFPLGHLPKAETRALALALGLEVADKPDSQDICFVPQGRYVDVVSRLRPNAQVPGDIVHTDGRVMGRHEGIINYTIGQRRGLDVGGQEEPLYVVRLDPAANRVIVGPRSALARTSVFVKDINWLGGAVNDNGRDVLVKLRSAAAPVPGTYFTHPEGRGEVRLHAPYEGVAPGQACVMYDGSRVLGGGWIMGAA
ncbi:MAG: tRNA 2-thiouridine(34) synthase MnmA [Bdellovibrionales bacterium]